MNRRWPSALVFAMAFGLATPAWAHHPVAQTGVSPAEPTSVVEASVEASSFDRGAGFGGSWQVVTLAAQWRALDTLSLRISAPFAQIALDDGRRVIGLGDIEASATYQAWAAAHGLLVASVGLGLECPTGVVSDGLGAGHFELNPFVAASSRLADWLVVEATVVDKLAVGSVASGVAIDERAPDGAVFAPHQPHELGVGVGVSLLATPSLYASLRLHQILVIQGQGPGPTRGGVELGWRWPGRLRLAASVTQHLAGRRRKQLAAGLSAAAYF